RRELRLHEASRQFQLRSRYLSLARVELPCEIGVQFPGELIAAETREPRPGRYGFLGAAHAELSQTFPPDADQAGKHLDIHRVGDRGVMEHESATSCLCRAADLATGRDDVVDLAIRRRDAELVERAHGPSVEQRV